MRLRETRVERRGDHVRLVGVVERDGETLELFFAFPARFEPFVVDSADPFVPTLFVPCLQTGVPLEVDPPVSPLLLSRLERVQDIFLSWFPPHRHSFRKVAVSARARAGPAAPRAAGVGSFFSAGVDSFYTLLRSHRGETPRPTHLLFLKGIEQPLSRSRGTEAVRATVEEIARRTRTTLIAGESNIRDHFTLSYELFHHGAALASAGLALAGGLGTVLLASTYSYGQLRPWGSHPMLDPLWSTESLEVIHDGAEARRVDKVRALLDQPLALEHLRVCANNDAGPTNCGRCHKCVRTMLALDILGALPRAPLFPSTLPRDFPAIFRQDHAAFREEILDLARRTGGRPDLVRLLERTSRGVRRREALHGLLDDTPLLPWIRRLRRLGRPASAP